MSLPFSSGPGPFGQHQPSGPPFDPFGAVNPKLCGAMLERLYHFLDGELTEDRRVKIQGHLDACPSCFSAFDFEAELRLVVAARAQTAVPEALIARIRATLSLPPTV